MVGKVIQVMGPVIDIEFEGEMPGINEAIEVEYIVEGESKKLICEVALLIGDNRARTISMDLSEGVSRGCKATALGTPIKVPVGTAVLGRIFNVLGEAIDEGEQVTEGERWSIHRAAPKFEELSTKQEMFETGIKVVDLL
ncbi:MAG: synthase subunit beta, partial [Pseudomonadota bacterium]